MNESLDALLASIWIELDKAAGDKSHGWRLPVLATRKGEDADARTVVLREVDASARELLIYTDARSPKAAQVRAHPQGTLVHWCSRLNWQLRLRVRLTLETDGLEVSSRWARLKLHPAAQDYLSPLPPGSLLGAQALPERGSRGHFALLRAQVERIDWLGLRPAGHRRALWDDEGPRWLTP
ncbi:pyridoxamine 5'-phosphate oxidase [Inhella sp.]|uniref:pyridoxamine 5'-phosphate oxidase n=1 Tax=Inhella sp. TaxID=1921806 RepID=UPI0035B196FE